MKNEEKYQEKEITRKKREDVYQKFKNLKISNKLNKKNLILLLSDCETIEEIIIYYLDYLKATNDKDYLTELINYYKIITPESCNKHNIIKISEKQRFHELIKEIQNSSTINKYVENELSTIDKDIFHIFEEVTKDLDKDEKEKKIKDFLRWNTIYNTGIDFNDIYNEEYFYYTLSYSLLRDYEKGQMGVKTRKRAINEFIDIFKTLEKDKKSFQKYFEYICLGLLNVSLKKENENEIINIIECINNELEENFLDLNGIKSILEQKGAKYSINGNEISIEYKNKNLKIDDYKKYNLCEEDISILLKKRSFSCKSYLNTIWNFDSYINKNNYFDGLLIKVILNYVKSNLSKNSIENLFNISQDSYSELYEQVTTENILDYIIIIPYNNIDDTLRTLKLYKKIIIDASKDVFNKALEHKLYSEKLKLSLNKFTNIVKRKYNFEHEQQHLVTLLLFYLYVNKKRRINSLPREIKETEIKFLDDDEYKEIKAEEKINKIKKENITKEAGESFEIFCYGNIQKKFYIKQLLFIANEKNDSLDCKKYKKNYKKFSENKLEKILQDFPKDQILSPLVEEIREGLKEEKFLVLEYEKKEKSYDDILNAFVTKSEDNLSALKDFENLELDIEEKGYDNHVYDRRDEY